MNLLAYFILKKKRLLIYTCIHNDLKEEGYG